MLAHRLSQDEIKEICVFVHGKHNDHLKEQLYQLTLDDDRRVAVNALWALTHFASSDHEWLYAKRYHLIAPLHRGAGCDQASVVARPSPSSAIWQGRYPYRLYGLLLSANRRLEVGLCRQGSVYQTCLRADALLARTARRTASSPRHDRLRTVVARTSVGLETGDKENKCRPVTSISGNSR